MQLRFVPHVAEIIFPWEVAVSSSILSMHCPIVKDLSQHGTVSWHLKNVRSPQPSYTLAAFPLQ